jgi:hypothetical protein
VGAVSQSQGSREVAHNAGPQGLDSCLYPHQQGKMHEVNVLDILVLEPGAFYVLDRGYVDFARLFQMPQAGSFFVTRAKSNMNTSVYSAKLGRSSDLVCDQSINLNGHYISQDYPEHLRRIRFNDPTTKQTLVFLTNNTALPPLTIDALFKSRW